MAKAALKEVKADPKAHAKEAAEADEKDSAPRPKKKRSVLKLALVLVPLLGGAGGGAWYFLQDSEPVAPAKGPAAKAAPASKAVSSKPPVFLPLDSFTVNLQPDDTSSQFLQVGLSLKVIDNKSTDEIKLRMPEIRNRVLLLLANKKASEISTSEQKQALSGELTREISKPLAGSPAASAIETVLFTSFVVQ